MALVDVSEAAFQAETIELARMLGWRCAHFRAAQTLHGWRTPVAGAAIDNMAGRLAGADSDGHAQAVCHAIAGHLAHNGTLPWPSVRRPYDEWAAAHQRAEAPL